MQALELLPTFHTSVWYSIAGLLYLGLTITAALHVLLNKEQEGTAIAWLGVILLSPGIGMTLYWLLGINRIKRRALREFPHLERRHDDADTPSDNFPDLSLQWRTLMTAGASIHQNAYIKGNQVIPLIDGDEAYPAMLQAIQNARESIILSSYIFDYDDIGRRFVETLGEAHQRGVLIRVMIDGIGIGYSFSWIKTDRALRELGIRTARFLPTWSRKGTRFINLRNHRKILSIDGRTAFVGGINIRDNNLISDSRNHRNTRKARHATRDIHFQLHGPVIDQINALFIEDWYFACTEALSLPGWKDQPPGDTVCRILPGGPDENYLKLQLTLASAINAAINNIRVITPYFLPGTILTQALEVAVLRGVKVEIILPKKSNIPLVDWAFRANLSKLLGYGVQVYFSPPPFDHSKLFMVDDSWCLIGSSNWDARSLELNFEVNLECFDHKLNQLLTTIFIGKQNEAQLVTDKTAATPALPKRIRNSICRLFSPYL